ncbi:MAG: hypothetical protein DMF49_07730 [Acidobacteria bacterium]|nr:MAG: hypothetical protein DMF49_07730 [Acidobacteriota bacterium]
MTGSASAEWWRPATVGAEWGSGEDSPAPFWALLAFTFVMVISPQTFIPALAMFRPALLAAAIALAAYFLDRLTHHRPLQVDAAEIRLAACLAVWAVLSVPFSLWPGGSVWILLEVYLKSLVVFWLLANTVSSVERLRQLIWALTIMSVPLAATATRNYLSGALIQDAAVKRIAGYGDSLAGNPNDLALTLNLILPLSLSLLVCVARPALRALLAGIIALDAIAVLLTFSRAGFLTLVVVAVLAACGMPGGRFRGWVLAAGLMLLLSAPLLAGGYLGYLRTITDIQADPTGSAQERWRDMLAAARFVLANPVFGAGVGMNGLALNELRGQTWRMVHNAYLEYAVDLGLPGLILFLLLLGGCLRAAWQARRLADQGALPAEFAAFSDGIRACLIAFSVAAMFHPVSYHFYFYYSAALAVAARDIARRAAAPDVRS